MRKKRTDFTVVRSAVFFGAIVLLGLAMLWLIAPFFYPLFWAAVVAALFYPIYDWLATHSRMRKTSSFITILLVIALLFIPLFFIAYLLVQQSIDLYGRFTEGNIAQSIDQTTNWLLSTPLAPYVAEARSQWIGFATDAGQKVASFLFTNATAVTQSSARFVFMFFIMLYALFYFFTDGPRILKRLMHLSPLGDEYEVMLFEKFTSAARATLKSTIIIGGIQGALGGILFWAVGIPSPLIWAVIMAIVAILPALGVPFIIIPAGIIQFFIGNMWSAIILLVGALVISFIDNILRPPLVGHDTQMHPLVVFFSTLGGIIIFGISGFVIGPVIAALFLAVMTMYDAYYKKELDNN